jgi:hypothetical protein
LTGALLVALLGAGAAPPFDLGTLERDRVLTAARAYLEEAPATVTASSSPRSSGGKHDFFS